MFSHGKKLQPTRETKGLGRSQLKSHFRDYKAYYLNYIGVALKSAFPQLLSYTRFVALIPPVLIPLYAYLQTRKVATTGISFVDATLIIVCHMTLFFQIN
ncbi:MAG: hypothetical protein AABY34_04270 [Pseudomonadota bacterium]